MRRRFAAVLLFSTLLTAPAAAQDANRSKPVAIPLPEMTAPKDVPYPGGTIKLDVDATDTVQRIFRVKETIPVAASGKLTLAMPAWLPGNHAPRGQIEKLTGLTWDEAVRQRLSTPLGLRSAVTLPEEAILLPAAVGHDDRDGEKVPAAAWQLPRDPRAAQQRAGGCPA